MVDVRLRVASKAATGAVPPTCRSAAGASSSGSCTTLLVGRSCLGAEDLRRALSRRRTRPGARRAGRRAAGRRHGAGSGFGGDAKASHNLAFARRTSRLEQIVHHLGLALGGRPGASLAQRLRLPVSRDTLLRVIRRRFEIADQGAVAVIASPGEVVDADDAEWIGPCGRPTADDAQDRTDLAEGERLDPDRRPRSGWRIR
jgi:hypothetical protein